MDTPTIVMLAKWAIVLFGVVVFLRLFARAYELLAEMSAGDIAEAALRRTRDEAGGKVPEPRLTLAPANDDQQQPS